jgi:hypothetical protein
MTDRKHLSEQEAEKFLTTAKGILNEFRARNLFLFKLKCCRQRQIYPL